MHRSLLYSWLLLAVTAHAATVTVDESTTHQTMEGWGACMITWSLGSTPYWNPTWRADYRDAGCNIVRMDMKKSVLVDASGDMRVPVPLSSNLQANIAKMSFTPSEVSVYGQMAQWLAQNALETNRVKIVGIGLESVDVQGVGSDRVQRLPLKGKP